MNQFTKPPSSFVPTLVLPVAPRPISGASFLTGGGGGGSEGPNTLRSHQTARVLDILGEGPIVGPWDGVKSIYYDGVPVRSADGTDNFENYTIQGCSGYYSQPVLKGFKSQQSDHEGPGQLLFGFPKTITINDSFVDRCRVIVSVPSLLHQKKKKLKGSHVNYVVRVQKNGGGYQEVTRDRIEGKTNTTYQRQLIFDLPNDNSPSRGAPWHVQIERLTEDSDDTALQNDLNWDAYTEIIDVKINYTLTAVLAHTVRAEDFSSIPKRVVDCGGMLIRYPSNYNPETRVYSGTWDGTFVTGYCNNPVWVFYDLVVEGRYGIGQFIDPADIDIYELYSIAQFCDGRVSVPGGGSEPRWVFNGVISEQQEAFDLLANIASVWRGSAFWASGKLVPTADRPMDPVFNFSNANVVDGVFNYASGDRNTRHNQVAVAWNDPSNLGERRLVIVENKDSIEKTGTVLKTDVVAMGCTSENQAQRVGEWLIYTETYESDTCTFTAGMEGAYVRPGFVCQVSDVTISGARRSGRLVEVHSDYVILDDSVVLREDTNYFLTAVRPNGNIITLRVHGNRMTPITRLELNDVWGGSWPDPDSVWSLASDDIEPTLWRVVRAAPQESDKYEITCIAHNPSKWAYIERDKPLQVPDVSNIGNIPGITNLKISDYMYALSPISLGNKMVISWQSHAPYFDVAYRETDGPWTRLVGISQTSIEVDVDEDDYDIWITPRNGLGRRGQTTKAQYTVIGRTVPPVQPINFRIQVVNGVAMFQWAVSTEIDVLIGGSYELRYSPRTLDATWASSNKIITSIPGTATTVEVPYRPGTYFLRSKDIGGLMSTAPAVIITNVPQVNAKNFIKIVEQPTFLGTHDRTTILMPQQWLIIADPNLEGKYTFKNGIDMGGVFPVVLTVDMFAFPYIEGSTFIDDRDGLVDDWQDWDNANDDGQGMVTINVRQTNDDPASGAAVWTEWKQFISGQYEGRGFQFQAWLGAPEGQNVGIEELGIIADVSAKQDSRNDVVWNTSGAPMAFTYTVKFNYIPAVSVAIQDAVAGDYFVVTAKSKTGFTVQLKNGTTAITTARKIDWIAAGW